MAKPPVIEDKQFEHLIKATTAYSRMSLRDAAILLTLYGTALSITELATITVSDYLTPNGAVRIASAVRPDVAHNGTKRALYWSNRRVVTAIDAYLTWRFSFRYGRTTKRDAFRGLDPDSPLFLTEHGESYSLTKCTLPRESLATRAIRWGRTSHGCTPTLASRAEVPNLPAERWRASCTIRAMTWYTSVPSSVTRV